MIQNLEVVLISQSFDKILSCEYEKPYFLSLMQKLDLAYQTTVVFPPRERLFEAFELTPFDKIKCVILGQDPYHNENQAHGLAFSVKPPVAPPPSLRNILTELKSDLNLDCEQKTDLTPWAERGVLLLNTVLSVEKNKPTSHKDFGWKTFTTEILKKIDQRNTPVVFILWGNEAISYKKIIKNPIHCVLTSPHPSPLSSYRGFFGSKPFSKCNDFLIKNNIQPIDFNLGE